MSMRRICSPPVRLPLPVYTEVKALQIKFNLNFHQAYDIWEKKKYGKKWERF